METHLGVVTSAPEDEKFRYEHFFPAIVGGEEWNRV
jgi:hypothetical protein